MGARHPGARKVPQHFWVVRPLYKGAPHFSMTYGCAPLGLLRRRRYLVELPPPFSVVFSRTRLLKNLDKPRF